MCRLFPKALLEIITSYVLYLPNRVLPAMPALHLCAHLCYEVELVHVVLAREDGLAAQQLSHDAPNRPAGAGSTAMSTDIMNMHINTSVAQRD